jgi:hypothetical protein
MLYSMILYSILSVPSLEQCSTIIYESKGMLSYWRPQVWLSDQEGSALNKLMRDKDRCVGKAFIKRDINHITVYWK